MKIPKALATQLMKFVIKYKDEFDKHYPPKLNIFSYVFDEEHVFIATLSVRKVRKEIYEYEINNTIE